MRNVVLTPILICVFLFSQVLYSEPNQSYIRENIGNARFGESNIQTYLEKAYHLAEMINKEVKGQEVAAEVLQSRVIQYLENFGNRSGEPVYLNLMGLPGIGKSAMLNVLKEVGFNVARFDVQNYTTDGQASGLFRNIREAIDKNPEQPTIVLIEELDKVPEIAGTGEVTSEIIGGLNQVLSEGIIRGGRDVSNVMFISSMNLSPQLMENFLKEVIGQDKSFYDLTIADMELFDQWLRNRSSAKYKLLSLLFRSNTVRRLAPFTVIMQPLTKKAYREIIDIVIRDTIKRNSAGKNHGKRINVEVDQSLKDFLVRETVYAPSGAGETILRADALIDQLITFGIKADDPTQNTIDRPRKIDIRFDENQNMAIIRVTPQVYKDRTLQEIESFEITAQFNRSSGIFSIPSAVATTKPKYVHPEGKAKKEILNRDVIAFRYPKAKEEMNGLKEFLQTHLVGQDETIDLAVDELGKYLGRNGDALKEPSARILAGFPGLGKSEIVRLLAQHLKLPIVKVNMQQFSSDDASSVVNFILTLESEISKVHKESSRTDRKYILLIEEIDKVFEIAPDGRVVNRPNMAIIKDLLNDGTASVTVPNASGGYMKTNIDAKGAFIFGTMNFSVDRFGFSADPRMTSTEDVYSAWKKLKSSMAGLKDLLGKMFLPETVSRLLSRFTIMPPLRDQDYKEIVSRQLEQVLATRVYDNKGRNLGRINVELSIRYKKYLMNETVVPSEGARNTVVGSQSLIATHLEDALSEIPKSKYGAKPIDILLDYYPGSQKVIVKVKLSSSAEKPQTILEKPVALNYPRLDAHGRLPEKRLKTSAHEFGHAFVALRLGSRIEQIVSVPTIPGAGGYVKYKTSSSSTGIDSMIRLYSGLASRAMERMILSRDPLSNRSYMEITSGPSQDIVQSTQLLYTMLFELGFDPNGGTIDRNLINNGVKYADISSVPPDVADKLSKIMRDMENYILEDLMSAHTKEWYIEKITKLAREGAMNEKEFYELVDYKFPEGKENYGRSSKIQEMFKSAVIPKAKSIKKARAEKRSDHNQTVEETLELYLNKFLSILDTHLHPEKNSCRSLF